MHAFLALGPPFLGAPKVAAFLPLLYDKLDWPGIGDIDSNSCESLPRPLLALVQLARDVSPHPLNFFRQALRTVLTGDCMGLDVFLTPEEGLTFARACASSPWLFPVQEDRFPDVRSRISDDAGKVRTHFAEDLGAHKRGNYPT